MTLGGFLDQVASPAPTPGGGTVSAVAGAMAASLAAMVAGLTAGKKKFAASEPVMNQVRREAATLRGTLMSLARRDSEAFDAVLGASRMPHVDAAETEARERALASAYREAARVPLGTAEACLEVLRLAEQVARLGNPNAASDAGVAGLLARAAAEGAILNVEINLKSLPAGADKDDVEAALRRVSEALGQGARRCAEAVHSALNA